MPLVQDRTRSKWIRKLQSRLIVVPNLPTPHAAVMAMDSVLFTMSVASTPALVNLIDYTSESQIASLLSGRP